jgi:membrane protein
MSAATSARPSPRSGSRRLGGLTLAELGRRVWSQIGDDEILDRAAALSYYFILALFPLLLFLAALFGIVPKSRLMDQLLDYLARGLPPDAAHLLERTVAEILRGARGGLVSLGAVAALWAASSGMASIMSALNVAYDATDARPWWHRRLLAVILTVVFSAFMLTAMVALVVGPEMATALVGVIGLAPDFTAIWTALRWPAALLLAFVGLGLIYYLAPAVRQRWSDVLPGSAIALMGWVAASMGLRLYVTNIANYNVMYGSIGGAIVLLLWLYLSGLMLLLGAEVNSEIAQAARAPAPARTVSRAA